MKRVLILAMTLVLTSGCALTEGEWFPNNVEVNDEEVMATDSSEEIAASDDIDDAPDMDSEDELSAVTDNTETEDSQSVALIEDEPQQVVRQSVNQSSRSQAKASKQQQIRMSVTNDYHVFQALNHQYIKSNQTPTKYQELEITLSHFVMDLIANMAPENFKAPLVVRPMTLNVNNLANPEAGKEMLTSIIAKQMKEYGFVVFDGRKPKGKFTGEELLLETTVNKYGEQLVLNGTLKQLSSNKIAGTNQAFITDYFFRNIIDGVEVYEYQSDFSTGGN
jgi:hypothetical protein